MNKQTKKVMLGCWGIGGSLSKLLSSDGKLLLEQGPFKGKHIPSASLNGVAGLSSNWHLPPLARETEDGIDLMPFILYDTVTVDKLAFECMLGSKPSLKGWRPKPENVAILEKLASEKQIVLEDYISRLNRPDVSKLIDDMNMWDLSDLNIIGPAIESLQLWIQFYKDLFGYTDAELAQFYDSIASLKSQYGNKADALGYLYECISDINRVLILAQEFKQPIYEWEDYCRYYRYKFLRVAANIGNRPPGRTLAQLFNIFIPDFHIRDYAELMNIRHDPKLESVRKLVEGLGDTPITKDLVIQAHEDVIQIKNKLETFSKYVGYAGYPLGLVLTGPFNSLLKDVTNAIARHWLENKVQWQLFFVERAIKYKKNQIQEAIRKDTE
jgi:hypothetical protein